MKELKREKEKISIEKNKILFQSPIGLNEILKIVEL